MKKTIFIFTFLLAFYSMLLPLIAFAQNNRIWATFYGGTAQDFSYNVITDTLGNVYMTGSTGSTSNIASGGFQNIYGGGTCDAFLVKFDSAGNRLWATYYGGPDNDGGTSLCIDHLGNIYMAGVTKSTSGIASGGFQNNFGGGTYDAFLVKFDVNGNRLWATYYGGSGDETDMKTAVDTSGNVYLSGHTGSNTGIALNGFQNTFGGMYDAFLVKFDSGGNRIWSTYYGGPGNDSGFCLATDIAGNVYLGGTTTSDTCIAYSGFQNSFGGIGGSDAYLVKFNPAGNRLWATYYGSGGTDGACIAVDPSGNVYLTGTTSDITDIASNGFQDTLGGGNYDAYIVKFNSAGNRLWGTYYGGAGTEFGIGIASDPYSNIYLSGWSNSTSYIAFNGFQDTLLGPTTNWYLASFDASGNRLCATYYGLSSVSAANVATDRFGNAYLSAFTNSISDIAPGGFQNYFGGGTTDAYLVKFTSCFTALNAIAITNDKNCPDHCTASASVTAQGGVPPYNYNWNTIPVQTTDTVTGLCAGIYTVTVMDNSGYSVTANVLIIGYSLPVVIISADSTNYILQCNQTFNNYQWYCNSNIISGATFQTYSPIQNGDYTVEITDSNGCTVTSAKFNVTWVGIEEIENENSIIISPNPTLDKIEIIAQNISEIEIMNIEGQLIKRIKTNGVQTIIDISDFVRGMYFIKATTDKGVMTKKFIKE